MLREQGLARLRGNELAVEHAKAALEALLAEAANPNPNPNPIPNPNPKP